MGANPLAKVTATEAMDESNAELTERAAAFTRLLRVTRRSTAARVLGMAVEMRDGPAVVRGLGCKLGCRADSRLGRAAALSPLWWQLTPAGVSPWLRDDRRPAPVSVLAGTASSCRRRPAAWLRPNQELYTGSASTLELVGSTL